MCLLCRLVVHVMLCVTDAPGRRHASVISALGIRSQKETVLSHALKISTLTRRQSGALTATISASSVVVPLQPTVCPVATGSYTTISKIVRPTLL